MSRPAENYKYEDSKFFFDMRIYPNEDNFYMAEIASSEKGWREEREIIKSYFPDNGRKEERSAIHHGDWVEPIDLNPLLLDNDERMEDQYIQRETILTRNTMKFGLQFGKIYKDLAFRFGVFENTGGLAVDFDVPFKSDKFRWVTSIEAYDMVGWNRINDRRPHIKWLNRMYLMRNIYFTFGADDFISKHNASTFAGLGIRFGDDDIKYIMPNVGGAQSFAG